MTLKNPARLFSFSLFLLSLEGFASLLYLLSLPGDLQNAWFLGYTSGRLALAALLTLGLLAAFFAASLFWRRKSLAEGALAAFLDFPPRLQTALLGLLAAGLTIAALALNFRLFVPELFQATMLRLYPLIFFFTAACFHILLLLVPLIDARRRQSLVTISGLSFLLVFYLGAVLFHAGEINTDILRGDQNGFVAFTAKVYDSEFSYSGNRNFMPAYAYLQALFFDPAATLEEVFLTGKLVNIVLSVVILIILYVVFTRYLSRPFAMLLTLMVAYTLFIFRAAYLQPELLFYLFSFLAYLLMLLMLFRPSPHLALATGVVLVLAHLTKASVLPGMLAFGFVFLLKTIVLAMKQRLVLPSSRQRSKSLVSRLIALGLVALVFLGLLFPYLRESKQKYGQYFYNVNSTFYIWYDTWTEAIRGTRGHGDIEGWPDLPPEEIPSFQKYVREHSLQQMLHRVLRGLGFVYRDLARPYGMLSYLFIYLAVLGFLLLGNWPHNRHLISRYAFELSFAALYFGGYFILYAWYAPIAGGTTRFVSSLYIPLLFSTFLILERFVKNNIPPQYNEIELGSPRLIRWVNVAVLALLTYEIFFHIPLRLLELVF